VSAVRIGAGTPGFRGLDDSSTNSIFEFIGKIAKWIPAEIVTLYGAGVTAMQPAADAADKTPVISVELWVVALVGTAVLIFAAAMSAGQKNGLLRAALGMVAFVIWSATIPHSAWEKLSFFTTNEIVVYVGLGIAAVAASVIFDRLVGDST
jgi:hypothetical protein